MWTTTTRRSSAGFTLIEAILSLVILALMASAMTGLYFSGFRALDLQAESMLIDSALRSKIEYLLAEEYSQLSSGTEAILLTGESETITWTVAGADLDEDSIADPDAKKVTVSLRGHSLSTIVVNAHGNLGKI